MPETALTREEAIETLHLADGYDHSDLEKTELLKSNAEKIEQALTQAANDSELRVTAIDMLPYIRRFMTNTGQIDLLPLYNLADASIAAADAEAVMSCGVQIGIIAHERGDDVSAAKYLQAGLEVAKEPENLGRIGALQYRLGDIALHTSSLDKAKEHFEKSLLACQKKEDFRGIADATYGLAHVERKKGNDQAAVIEFEKAAPIYEQASFPQGAANCLFTIGEILITDGAVYTAATPMSDTLNQAQEELEKANALYLQTGYNLGKAHCLKWEADRKQYLGETSGLHEQYQQAYDLYTQIKDTGGASLCLRGQGKLAAAMGDTEKAAHYYRQAIGLLESLAQEKQSNGEPRYEALVYEDMASISRTDTGKKVYLQKAAKAWENAECPDRAVQLQEELAKLPAAPDRLR